jgi:hypothetical protein
MIGINIRCRTLYNTIKVPTRIILMKIYVDPKSKYYSFEIRVCTNGLKFIFHVCVCVCVCVCVAKDQALGLDHPGQVLCH